MLEIRPAGRDDVELVSQCVLAAVNLYDFINDSIEKDIALLVCGRDDTLYSWTNARIAVVDGVRAGCLVSYDGAIYEKSREITFRYFKDAGREMDSTETETGPGEYYLDSMAIRPEFRGLGIGHMLMRSAIDEALANGFTKVSLIVETTKPTLQKYYSELGFVTEKQIFAFGDTYNKMTMESTVSNSPAQAVFDIFKEINGVPRPSHHEEKIADWLCGFARKHNLEYDRDQHNCVVIRKGASKGYEDREPLVILNHMDMVCVADAGIKFDPENSPIRSYVDNGWLKAAGTSLGSDNGIGLSMALAILADDSIEHPALEVLTTTNEEDGMSGAANLGEDFIKGRKVLNLDSEDYDTITTGAAGAYLQIHKIPYSTCTIPENLIFFRLSIDGGLGGHSGVDINKGRCNANKFLFTILDAVRKITPVNIADIAGGEANASIAMGACAVFGINAGEVGRARAAAEAVITDTISKYKDTDPGLRAKMEEAGFPARIICRTASDKLIDAVSAIPCGVTDPIDCDGQTTPVTSNNIGLVEMKEACICVSTHTRSFSEEAMETLGKKIKDAFGADTTLVMSAPAWRENKDSAYISTVSECFDKLLGFRPKKVEMHFVLEAGYYVRKYPGIEIACIGPRIVCPHSTKEKVDIQTVENIWKVVREILISEL